MNALTWITKEAKRIKRQHPRRFKKWTQYVAQASAIYKSKHGSTPVGRKKRVGAKRTRKEPPKLSGITTKSRTHTDYNRQRVNIQVGNIYSLSDWVEIQKRSLSTMKAHNDQLLDFQLIARKADSAAVRNVAKAMAADLKKYIAAEKRTYDRASKMIKKLSR